MVFGSDMPGAQQMEALGHSGTEMWQLQLSETVSFTGTEGHIPALAKLHEEQCMMDLNSILRQVRLWPSDAWNPDQAAVDFVASWRQELKFLLGFSK